MPLLLPPACYHQQEGGTCPIIAYFLPSSPCRLLCCYGLSSTFALIATLQLVQHLPSLSAPLLYQIHRDRFIHTRTQAKKRECLHQRGPYVRPPSVSLSDYMSLYVSHCLPLSHYVSLCIPLYLSASPPHVSLCISMRLSVRHYKCVLRARDLA